MTPSWLSAQRSLQQNHHHHHHPHHQQPLPFSFRSATPPPLLSRPCSAAAAASTSPPRGRHVIPRSHSVLHARPPSAPRISNLSPSPSPLDQHQQPSVSGTSQAESDALEAAPRGSIGSSHLQVDYSAIQRIADGVERMVRSWTSENSCRAQVYAKAYDSLHAAAARGKDEAVLHHQQHPRQESMDFSSGTDPSLLKLEPHSENMSARLLAVQNLQSPADPNMVEMTPCIFDTHHGTGNINLISNEEHFSPAHQQVQVSSTHAAQTSYGGLGDGYNANLSIGAPPYETTGSDGRNPLLVGNKELLYTEGPPYPIGQDAVKKLKTGNNMCVHNRTHNYPIGLGLIKEDDDTEQKSAGSLPNLTPYSHNQLDNLRVDYDPRVLARSQHGKGQQGELAEGGATLQIQQKNQRSNHIQSMPLLIRNDTMKSNSLVKANVRSRSPSLRTGASANTNAINSLEVYHEGPKIERRADEKYEAKVKELEISLLECATEYEVQLVEMKMKMLQMKSEFRHKSAQEETKLASSKVFQSPTQDAQSSAKSARQGNASPEVPLEQRLEPTNLKRRVHREKYSENVPPTQPKTRVDGVLKKSSSGDSEKIVTCLQKLLSRKEQELSNSKFREKELAGQIHELQTTVQRGRVTQMEPKKLLSLLLALSEWLQSVKAGVLNDDPTLHRRAYQNVHALAHLRMNLEDPQNANRTNNNQSPRLENLATIVNKEIKTLQEILGKLAPYKRIK